MPGAAATPTGCCRRCCGRVRPGLDSYWLLVTGGQSGARELYARAGFRETGRYLYRQERPKRHLTGC